MTSAMAVAYGCLFEKSCRAGSMYRNERRRAFFLDEERQESCRLGTARVPADDMDIIGTFIERLPRGQCNLLSTLNLHDNSAFQHVDECVGIVTVDWVGTSRRIFHEEHEPFLSGTIR